MKTASAGLRRRLSAAEINRAIVQHQVVQRPLRVQAKARLRLGRIAAGVSTVVIVNWNSRDFLEVTLRAVELYSPPGTRVLVVDNHSTDESRSLLARHPGVKWVALPHNVGHELALDIGFLLARTEFVIALDVDAFPIDAAWVDHLRTPLDNGYQVAGAHVRNGFVHPCCLAMRLERFVGRKHTFLARLGSGRLAENADDVSAPGWDTGWSISLREDRRFLFDRTGAAGPGDIGSYWDGLIYHNFYSTRFGSKRPLAPVEIEVGVSPDAASTAWERAVSRYFPEETDPAGTSSSP
jgi:glycosyltransferase involved in cell wall biosynthesis